jgi:hypothetical protein
VSRLTDWSCHVCGELRPDDKIAVCKRSAPYQRSARPPIPIRVNVRYCVDRAVCTAVAPVIAAAWLADFIAGPLD